MHDSDHRSTGIIWALCHDWEHGMFTSPNNKIVAEIKHQAGERYPWRGSEGEEFEANARLVAAAPDLLNACEVALAHISGDPFGTSHNTLLAAIKKAKGRTD